jgi:GntR family transcriptional repressor for pyruvate dehydrogenase complex
MSSSETTVSKAITSKLIARIIDGVYPPGSKLPTEREIAEEFDVTRNVVREALKRLEALGLVTIRRGSGIYVEDLQLTGGVELLELLIFKEDGSLNIDILRDIIEFYENSIISIIRLATQRMTQEELKELEELVGKRAELIEEREEVEKVSRDITALIVDATHNSLYRLIYNTMLRIPILSTGFFGIIMSFNPDIQEYFERLVETIKQGDQEMASMLTSRMYEAYEDQAARILIRMAAGQAET